MHDPPWLSDSGGGGKGANAQYALLHGRKVAGQIRMSGVWDMQVDALAWVWATTLSMVSGEVHEYIATLGLRPCCTWPWVKVEDEPDELGRFVLRRKPGMGQWQFCDHEFLITCRRGNVQLPEVRERSPILEPVTDRHSEKPQKAWRLIESVSRSALRKHSAIDAVEFNSRAPRPGWGAYGTLDPDNPDLVSFRAADRRFV